MVDHLMVDHTNKVVDHNLLVDHRLWSTIVVDHNLWATTNGYGRQFVVYLPRKLGRDAVFRCKLTIQSRYKEVYEKIHRYLNNDERTHFFEQSAFEPEDLSDRDVFGTTHFSGKSEIALSDLEGKINIEVHNETGIDVEKIKMRYNYLTEAQGRKEVDVSLLVGGFVLPLQVARRRDVEGLMLPRMFQWVTNTWSSNRARTGADIAAAFGGSPIDDCLRFLTPTPEELVSPYYTTGIFVDSAPDAVITRVLELWRKGETVICSEHPLESPSVQHTPSAHSSPVFSGNFYGDMSRSVQHTLSANASQDVSGTRSGDLNRSSSSTSSPMRTGPRVHFGLNPSRHPSPLEHRFERRLTALEDSVASMHVKMSAEFIETRTSIRNIDMALDDLKSSFNLGLDELRSSLTEQIRAGFAEMRSNMLVHQDKDYSIAYSRGRKRKSSEADFGVDDNLAKEIDSSSQTQHIFEPNLPVITEESSEDIQATPDARNPVGEATTSRGYYTAPCLFIFALKLF
ncbi:uncharacterized protein [Primulina huaijiensis]|uniref:uncharacterized protein n=1 Tax=Primulina huaijiensis TaxID=1492673 RepID=UPI003CC73BB1